MSKITLIKVGGPDYVPNMEDLLRWKRIFEDGAKSIEQLSLNPEINVEVIEDCEEPCVTIIRIGDPNNIPTALDIKSWREIFEESKGQKDFQIFTHYNVSIDKIKLNEYVIVE